MLSQQFDAFISECFDYQVLKRYSFNYGDNVYRKHKIVEARIPLYICSHYNFYDDRAWMDYVKIVIDTIAASDWFNFTLTLYGTLNESYLVTEYQRWTDVIQMKQKSKTVRVINTGPSDMTIDVFWIQFIDHITNYDNIEDLNTSLPQLEYIFKSAIWFFICESDNVERFANVKNNISPYSL
ncbi:hypothetical protein SlGVgp098 [Spodoptera litura granulovirus]|uniref:Uncharacterized protein n=1 Tax=Spodoptera litura granulovirus TaxID=359919 RepID=A5IZV0_9BBAC|nr:hypothetical protein SlGVgp098 [Spodoptera litura granulovirus]ABQ52041.1 hypothetical protein SlGVgp098 [Spodoptera litura granulovirus]